MENFAVVFHCSGIIQAAAQSVATSGLAVQDQEQAQAVLKAGWSMGQEQEPLSVQLWRLFSGTVPVNPYYQLESGFPVLQQSAYKKIELVAEEEAYYASAFVADSWKHRFEKVGDITVSQDVQVVLYHTHNAETYLPTMASVRSAEKRRCGTGCRGVSGCVGAKIRCPHSA